MFWAGFVSKDVLKSAVPICVAIAIATVLSTQFHWPPWLALRLFLASFLAAFAGVTLAVAMADGNVRIVGLSAIGILLLVPMTLCWSFLFAAPGSVGLHTFGNLSVAVILALLAATKLFFPGIPMPRMNQRVTPPPPPPNSFRTMFRTEVDEEAVVDASVSDDTSDSYYTKLAYVIIIGVLVVSFVVANFLLK